MLNFQNNYLIQPSNLLPFNGQMAMVMMPNGSFYPSTQQFRILNSINQPNLPFIMMSAQQNPMQFYYHHQQLSQQDYIQQQKLQQSSYYEQIKFSSSNQNPQQQHNLLFSSSPPSINSDQDPSLVAANSNQQSLLQPFCMADQKNDNHHPTQSALQSDQKPDSMLENTQTSAKNIVRIKYPGLVKAEQDNSYSDNLNSIEEEELLKNSKKRTSVTSTTSTASSCTSHANETSLLLSLQQKQQILSLSQHSNQDEEGRRKYLSLFEPHVQLFLQQLHEQSYSLSFTGCKPMKGNNIKINKSDNSNQIGRDYFEGEEDLQNLVGKNAYLKWAISSNRNSHFAKESLSQLISNNQKYSNMFKLKKKIRKLQQLAHNNNKLISQTKFQNKNHSQNIQENETAVVGAIVIQTSSEQQQNLNQNIIQKTEFNQEKLSEELLSQNLDDSFDEKFTEKEENNSNKKNQTNQVTDFCQQNKFQQISQKSQSFSNSINSLLTCTCNQENIDNLAQEIKRVKFPTTISTDCLYCSSLYQSKQDQSAEANLKTEVIEMEQEIEASKKDEEEESSLKSGSQASSKKAINSKFHNMNKLFMYKLLSFFYLENLERLNVPFNIREILKRLISLVKLSSKQQSQFQSKQKTDFFSHDHYNLLFLTLNNQTIQYMRENSNNKILHQSCFNFDLNDVKLPLEHSQNSLTLLEKIEYINIVKKYACEIVLQSDLGEDIDEVKNLQSHEQAAVTKQIYTKRALQGIKVLNQGLIVRRF